MDFEIAVVGVGFARQQRFELAPRHFGLSRLSAVFGLRDGRIVLFGFAQIDQHELIVEIALDAGDGVELVVQGVALAHGALRAGLIVPE